jgi:hypothetical protein
MELPLPDHLLQILCVHVQSSEEVFMVLFEMQSVFQQKRWNSPKCLVMDFHIMTCILIKRHV